MTSPKDSRRTFSTSDLGLLPSPPFKCSKQSVNPLLRSSSFHGGDASRSQRSLLRRPTSFHALESPVHHPRVSFQRQQDDDGRDYTKTSVINLSWTDSRGNEASYTGEVSELIQPHGFGFLVYKDGSVFSSMWCNGMPLREQATNNNTNNNEARLLDLGDTAHAYELQHPSPECAFESHTFPIHSFAFVLRSDGSWTYAILANRPIDNDGPEASMRFVVDKQGSTKIFKRRHWARYIRCVRGEDDMSVGGNPEVYQNATRGQVMNQACVNYLKSFRRSASQASNGSVKTRERSCCEGSSPVGVDRST